LVEFNQFNPARTTRIAGALATRPEFKFLGRGKQKVDYLRRLLKIGYPRDLGEAMVS
jgi:hypothetical protein